MSRRLFLELLAAAVAASASAEGRPRRLLLRSSWQTVNIGDIAHTPGVLAIMERHLTGVEVTLWPSSVDRGVAPMLQHRFPTLRIAEGRCDADGRPQTDALKEAFERCDLLVHGSGPSVVAHKDVAAWAKTTGKPYGIYGVTLAEISDGLKQLLSNAKFVYCRDTDSLKAMREVGVTCPETGFSPDGAFAFDLRDDATADAWLAAHGLREREFICAIPRLRWTPYHQQGKANYDAAEAQRRDEVNARYAEEDHAKLRAALTAWVRATGRKVLVCPEMTYQLDIVGPLVVDPLPDDVKAHVVRRETYWRPDEASSVYARAQAVVSFECHSPILAAAVGTPVIHLRQPTDTRKGQMYRDIGLGDWLFEIEQSTGEQIGERLLAITSDFPAAQAKLAEAMAFVRRRQGETMAFVGRTLTAT